MHKRPVRRVHQADDPVVHIAGQIGPKVRRTITRPEFGELRNTPKLRALRLLREEGLVEFRRGRGITVSGTPQRGAVLTRARELLAFARQHGYRRDDLIEILKDLP